MIKSNFFALAAGLIFFTACTTAQNNRAESGFTSVFDGKTLDGWTFVGTGKKYLVEDGKIVAPQGVSGDLYIDKQFSDFVLRLDYKLTPGANNGIGIRGPLGGGQLAFIGMEIQLIDDAAPKYADIKPWQKNGSVYGVGPAKPALTKPAGEWNQMEITAAGRRIKVKVNGKLVSDVDLNSIKDPALLRQHPGMFRDSGHIGLLGHHDNVEFRNIRVKQLAPVLSVSSPLRKNQTAPAGFTTLFNGRDLTGWKGLVADPIKRAKMTPEELAKEQAKADEVMRQNWKVENGELVYRGKGFDNLCTVKEYGDFELLADWKIEPKGDSGIYLRGSPQVQIWEPNSGGYDREHPGSGGLYNNKTHPSYASKHADHYVGEWNRFRILMVGEKVHIFLNNQLVLDNVTMENFWDRSQPILPFGPIELQAHRDPVRFKNIYVREIPRSETKKK